jgi:hypothetical protein
MNIWTTFLIPALLLSLDCDRQPQTEDRIASSPDSTRPLETTAAGGGSGFAAMPQQDDQLGPARRPKLIAHLLDGSHIVGIPTCDAIAVRTPCGSFDLPFMDLPSIDFGPGEDSLRHQGIGSQLLVALRDLDDPCTCVPYTHLETFYGRAGFVPLEEHNMPDFLRARAVEYRARGLSVLVMKREPEMGAPDTEVCARKRGDGRAT